MSLPSLSLRRLALVALAALCAAFVVACGGSSDEEGAAISEAIATAAMSENGEERCRELVTERFINDVYEDVETCIKATNDKDEDGPEEITVSEIEVDGDTATATVTEVGGDTDGATGTVTVAKVEGDWRVDELGIDYLRSQLEQGFANEDNFTEDEYGPLADASVRECVLTGFQELDDADFRQMAYDSMADREVSESFLGVIMNCVEQ